MSAATRARHRAATRAERADEVLAARGEERLKPLEAVRGGLAEAIGSAVFGKTKAAPVARTAAAICQGTRRANSHVGRAVKICLRIARIASEVIGFFKRDGARIGLT